MLFAARGRSRQKATPSSICRTARSSRFDRRPCPYHWQRRAGDTSFGIGDILNSIPTVTLKCLATPGVIWTRASPRFVTPPARHYADIAVRDAINRGEQVGPAFGPAASVLPRRPAIWIGEKILPPHLSLPGPAPWPITRMKHAKRCGSTCATTSTSSSSTRRSPSTCGATRAIARREMTFETMQALIEEAHWHGRTVTAHCYGGDGASWALDAGIDGIEHGFYLTDEQLEQMARQGTVLCPTLSVVGRFRDFGEKAAAGRCGESRSLAAEGDRQRLEDGRPRTRTRRQDHLRHRCRHAVRHPRRQRL